MRISIAWLLMVTYFAGCIFGFMRILPAVAPHVAFGSTVMLLISLTMITLSRVAFSMPKQDDKRAEDAAESLGRVFLVISLTGLGSSIVYTWWIHPG